MSGFEDFEELRFDFEEAGLSPWEMEEVEIRKDLIELQDYLDTQFESCNCDYCKEHKILSEAYFWMLKIRELEYGISSQSD